MTEKEKLEKQILDAKNKLAELENAEKISNRNETIKPLSEYSDQEKIDFFDKLYESAESELKDLEKTGYTDKQYAWESYITILARDKNKFWKYWNSIDN
jgi:hypothetical protein